MGRGARALVQAQAWLCEEEGMVPDPVLALRWVHLVGPGGAGGAGCGGTGCGAVSS